MRFLEWSTDRTASLLRGLFGADDHVRVIRFARNYGQQAAIAAGLARSRGECVVLTDCDLQQPPEAIPSLLDELAKGHRIVYGAATKPAQPLHRRVGSRVAYTVLSKVSGFRWPETLSAFVAMDRRLVDRICADAGRTPFFSGLAASLSDGDWAVVQVEHCERLAGTSKYSLWKLAKLGLRFLVSSVSLRFRAAHRATSHPLEYAIEETLGV